MSNIPHIFIAYSHEDKPSMEKLRTHLKPLQSNQHCHIFYDGEIIPGERWDKRLKSELHQANIFVLLVSPDFLASNYINETELPGAMQKWRDGHAQIAPVILLDCLWNVVTELSELQEIINER